MRLERRPVAGPSAVSKQPFRAFKLAWVLNALAAFLLWLGPDGAGEILSQLGRDQGALPIFLAGATSGALADASAGLMRLSPRSRRPHINAGGSEFLVGLSVVLLVVSVICLVLGIAAAASGWLDLARV